MSTAATFAWWIAGVVVVLVLLQQAPKLGAWLLLLIVFGALLRGAQKGTI